MTTEITLKKALQDCIESLRRLDDKEGAYRQTCIKQAEQAIINARPSRIVVSVSGGIAEIADAENWPQDLDWPMLMASHGVSAPGGLGDGIRRKLKNSESLMVSARKVVSDEQEKIGDFGCCDDIWHSIFYRVLAAGSLAFCIWPSPCRR